MSTDAAKLKAATTYNAAADHFDDQPLEFWARIGLRTVERLRLPLGCSVLDVGCGTGASALPAAGKVEPKGRVSKPTECGGWRRTHEISACRPLG
jgi:ubiquinone/menaquinone biosynthesis C-methylase UbiE